MFTPSPKQAETITRHVRTAERAASILSGLESSASIGDAVDGESLRRAALDLERAGCALRRLAVKVGA